jgi:hypothetical protein
MVGTASTSGPGKCSNYIDKYLTGTQAFQNFIQGQSFNACPPLLGSIALEAIGDSGAAHPDHDLMRSRVSACPGRSIFAP